MRTQTTPASRPWLLPVRVVASLAMVALLVTRLPDFTWSELVPERNAGVFAWLTLAFCLTFAGIAFSTIRWMQVLRALDVPGPLDRLMSHYLAAQFVSNALPTTIGGDVVRVSRLSRENGEAPGTFASVVLERLTGWLVLPLITFLGLALNPGLRDLDSATAVAVGVAVATLLGLVGVLLLIGNQKLGGRLGGHQGWRRFAGGVHYGVERLRHQPRAALRILAASFTYDFILVLSALAISQAIGIGDAAGLTALLAFLPAVLICQVLPLGIAGLGIREGAFVLFLRPLGVQPEQAVALGLLMYLMNLLASLAGAPSFAFGRAKLHAEGAVA